MTLWEMNSEKGKNKIKGLLPVASNAVLLVAVGYNLQDYKLQCCHDLFIYFLISSVIKKKHSYL